ncbi:MAG: AAA family ATPase [Lachnospiraceae bacterium]|nr:AAA family ATPase [Lachnospiraceae bacterium]
MGKYLNPNCSEILEQIKKPEFVDRSDLITELNNRIDGYNQYMAVYMPEGYGKTVATKLLTAYYSCKEKTRESFSKLAVGQSDSFEEHLNKYNVLFLDMYKLYDKAEKDILYIEQLVVDELKDNYPFLNRDIVSLHQLLYYIYEKTGQRWVIIIDECDYPYRVCTSVEDEKKLMKYYDFLVSVFKGFHADNYVALGYLTGREHIKHFCGPLRAGIDHFVEYYMGESEKLTKYFGIIQ